jgi:glycosyltransferase involved in cell wall biosynthesis
LIEAHALLAKRGRPIRLLLAGKPDPANPSSIPLRDIAAWQARPGIRWLGYVADVSAVWAQAHIAVLPSRREGLPLSLVEAASCGRPLVATDVPGCREIARHGVNAFLVPLNDAAALADAIDRLAQDPALRRRFGAAGRHIVVEEFSSRMLKRNLVQLYNSLIAQPHASGAD